MWLLLTLAGNLKQADAGGHGDIETLDHTTHRDRQQAVAVSESVVGEAAVFIADHERELGHGQISGKNIFALVGESSANSDVFLSFEGAEALSA